MCMILSQYQQFFIANSVFPLHFKYSIYYFRATPSKKMGKVHLQGDKKHSHVMCKTVPYLENEVPREQLC